MVVAKLHAPAWLWRMTNCSGRSNWPALPFTAASSGRLRNSGWTPPRNGGKAPGNSTAATRHSGASDWTISCVLLLASDSLVPISRNWRMPACVTR